MQIGTLIPGGGLKCNDFTESNSSKFKSSESWSTDPYLQDLSRCWCLPLGRLIVRGEGLDDMELRVLLKILRVLMDFTAYTVPISKNTVEKPALPYRIPKMCTWHIEIV